MQPDVSVIIPCYNQAKYLPELFRSIDSSTQRSVEIVLIDDGSPNDDVLVELRKLEPTPAARTLIVRRTINCGLAASRNLGLELSTGRFIKFLDADDLLLADSLDFQISELENEPKSSVHLVNYCLGDHDLSSFRLPDRPTLPTRNLTPSYVAVSWETELSIPIHCALFRSDSIRELRFNETLEAKEDWLFWHSLAQKDLRVLVSQQIGVIYRTHSGSMTRDRFRMARFWLSALDLIVESGTQIAEEDDLLITRHFNQFYLRSVNHGFFEENADAILETTDVNIPLTKEIR